METSLEICGMNKLVYKSVLRINFLEAKIGYVIFIIA